MINDPISFGTYISPSPLPWQDPLQLVYVVSPGLDQVSGRVCADHVSQYRVTLEPMKTKKIQVEDAIS